MRYLAIDLGQRRTGLALGDPESGIVTPLKTIEVPRGPALLDRLAAVVTDQRPDAIVIGLPLNMDGTDGPAAKSARSFGEEVAGRLELPVEYQDERLTSYAADHHMARSGLTHGRKKAIRDGLAAAEILRDFFAGLA